MTDHSRFDQASDRPARSVGCTVGAHHDSNNPDIDLLCPLAIRGVTIKNRIVLSPSCQYVARDGLADDWHLVHLGSRAVGGAGLVFTEATAVLPEGRISPGDLGLWDDGHVEPLGSASSASSIAWAPSPVFTACALPGRKGSCEVPWRGGRRLKDSQGGWPVVAPSPIPFADGDPPPIALDDAGIFAV